MKKNLILYILLVFLILVNSLFLFNYMGNGNSKEQKGTRNPGSFIVKELGFNNAQLENFREKSKGHHQTMLGLSDDIRNLKDDLFDRLSDASLAQGKVDSIASLIGEREKEIEVETFYHFKMIEAICNDTQKEKFKKIIKDALRRGGERGQRPPPRKRPDGHEPSPRSD